MRAHGIMFHHFHGDGHVPVQGSMSADELRSMIRFLGRDRILSAHEYRERALSNLLREGDLCLTFDDNLRCQYDVAVPVLRELGLTAFWFVYTSVLDGVFERLEIYRAFRSTRFSSMEAFYEAFFRDLEASPEAGAVRDGLTRFDPKSYLAIYSFYSDGDRRFRFVRDEVLGPERYNAAMDRMLARHGVTAAQLAPSLWMNEDCLRSLEADGHIIGLHSHTHPTRMAYLSVSEQEREYRTNYERLSRVLKEPPTAMSHPCNSYTPDTLELLERIGIRLGFRANLMQEDAPHLELPREDHANVLAAMREPGHA
jgi:peptidoglycan/xylan/chitin deacetylase (PgdA/CDA1 family)